MGIIWNNSRNMTFLDDVLVENDTIYKVLLYIAIMAIILILALGLYFITANKVCPYEFEDDNNNDDDQRRENEERERERRRRRRRRRHRRRHRSSAHHQRHRNNVSNNNQQMIELNEPMIQSAVNPLSINNNENNNDNQ